jgi:hypothetical protein
MERKLFMQVATMGTLGILAPKLFTGMQEKNIFIHHVYFWLKNPGSKEDYNKLLEGLKGLSKVSTIHMFHIGKPADTNRDVIDRSYSVSWMLMFRNKEDQDKYQVDPIHLKFVEQYAALWSRVIVYDSIDV